jgi:hypothetical protein
VVLEEEAMSNGLSTSPQTQPRGAMTAAMRAVRTGASERVLRIGKLERGRVIEERVIAERADVRVGTDHDNMFLVSGARAPETHRLFEMVSGSYVLNLVPGMTGRIALPTGVVELAHVIGGEGKKQLRLTPEARGKIVIDETVFLFQFVDPPLRTARAQLPLAVKTGLSGRIDWGFSILAAFSFLVHFGFAGAVNSDWFDPTIDDDIETAALVETAHARPPVPLEVQQQPTPTDENVAAKDPTPDPKSPPDAKNGSSAKPGNGGQHAGTAGKYGGSSETPSALDSKALDELGIKAIGAFDSKAPATGLILKPGSNVVDEQLDELAKTKTAISTTDGLKLPSGGEPKPIGASDGPITFLPGKQPSGPPKPAVAPKDPEVPIPPYLATPAPTVGNVPDADGVIARNRWRFGACYKQALVKNPTDGGTIRVLVTVGEAGEVLSAVPTSTTASSGLTSCVAASFGPMKFAAPTGGTGQFTAPVVLQVK